MVWTGPFADSRPWFCVAVTGHPDAVPDDGWSASPLARAALAPAAGGPVRAYLDAVLRYRRASHRLLVLCRDEGAGIDELVRAYCELRGLRCLPVAGGRDLWGERAPLHRDLDLLARAHAVVWFGPRERDGPDLVTLAVWFGTPCRVVPLPDLAGDPEGEV